MTTDLNIPFLKKTLRKCYCLFTSALFLVFLTLPIISDVSAQEPDVQTQEESSVVAPIVTPNTVTSRYIDGEELILTVLLDKYTLGDAFAITQNGSVLYDLATLVELLDFPIKSDSASKSLNGWYIKETNNFELKVLGEPELAGKLVINYAGNRLELEHDQYTFVDDVFYLSENSIEQVFEISFSYNFKKLQVKLLPNVTLPLLAKLAREAKQFNKTDNRTIKYANLPRSYELLSPQIFDFNLSSNYRESTDEVQTNYSLMGARDVALLHTNYSFIGNSRDMLTNGRLTFSRESINGGLLGFLNATNVTFGDVRPVRQATGSTSQETRGLLFGNASLTNAVENEVITLDGNVPIGWDVQILRNGILLDQQISVQSGRYEFVDVPLIFGENEFNIILFGPQGQIQNRKVSKLVDRNILRLQGLKYEFSINDGDNTLLGLDTINTDKDVGYNLSGRLSHGVGDSAVAQLGYQSQFGGEFNGSNITGSLSTILADDVLVNLNTSIDDKRNVSFGSTARTRLLGQSISLEYNFSDNFDNELDFARTDTFRLRVDGAMPLWVDVSLPYQNQLTLTDNGTTEFFLFNNRLSFYSPWFSVFNSLQYSQEKTAGLASSDTRGSLSLQKSLGSVFLKYSNSYSIDDRFELLNHKAEINWTISNNIRTKFSLSHDVASENNVADWQIGWFNDRLQFFGSAKYSDLNGYEVGLNTRVSLAGQNSEYNNIHQDSRGLVNTGSIAVRVFDDLNMNAIFDEGEQIIPGVKVKAPQVFKEGITNSAGIAMLTGIASFSTSDIEIDNTHLPDPFLVPLVKGVSITFRKGLVDTLDFPMTIGSDIEGMVTFNDGVLISQKKNVIVELRNKKNKLVMVTKTETDGYYIFAGVLPGAYEISIANESINAYEIKSSLSQQIEINRNTEVLAGQDFNLTIQGYQDGFITDLGNFTSIQMLNIYQKLLKQKRPEYKFTFFMHKIPSGSRQSFVLSSFHTFKKDLAEDQCEQLSLIEITCKVRSVQIPISV